jgi:hypothetical protein
MPNVKISFTPVKKKALIKIVDMDKVVAAFTLKAKKTLDGNIIIYDHKDIDVVIRPEVKKVVTYKKDGVNGEIAYGASDRMFKYLFEKGVIDVSQVQGGSTLDSFEVPIPDTNSQIPIKLIMLSLAKWIEKERPYFEYGEEYEDLVNNRVTEPDTEESTELGEVPQDKQKGSIVPGYYRSPYWMSYILENQE